jgi:Spy/CpxP family protein refolding chaperone
MIAVLGDELDLTAEQVNKIREIHEAWGDDFQALHDKRKALRDEYHEGNRDDDSWERFQSRMEDVRMETMELREEVHSDMKPVLTDEQWEKFEEIVSDRQEKMSERREQRLENRGSRGEGRGKGRRDGRC